MVEVRYSGKLGEILFQYCFARILAERFGYALRALPISGFPGTGHAVGGEEYLSPAVRWTGVVARDWGTGARITELGLTTPPSAKLILDGWFQRAEYHRDYARVIREDWLRLGASPEATVGSGELAVCIRFGKLAQWHHEDERHLLTYAPPVYSRPTARDVRDLVGRLAPTRLHILTDQPGNPLLKSLADLQPEIRSGGELDALRFLKGFRRVAYAQTAFDYWAAFLSGAEQIFPMPSKADRRRQLRRGGNRANTTQTDENLLVPDARLVEGWR